MLQNQKNRPSNMEELDAVFQNIAEEFSSERKFQKKKKFISIILGSISLLIVFFLISFVGIKYDIFYNVEIFAILVLLYMSVLVSSGIYLFLQYISESVLERVFVINNSFSKRMTFIVSLFRYTILKNIEHWIDGTSNVDIFETFNLLIQLKSKIYQHDFFFINSKRISKQYGRDQAFSNLDSKQIYYLDILKDEIYRDIYECIGKTSNVESAKRELIYSKVNYLDTEVNRIRMVPENTIRINELKLIVEGFKSFNFNNLQPYIRIKKLVNYEFKNIFEDIGKRRLRHTTIVAILYHVNTYKDAKSLYNSIESFEIEFSLNPFNLYFGSLKYYLQRFENLFTEFGLKLDLLEIDTPLLKNKDSLTSHLAKETMQQKREDTKNKAELESFEFKSAEVEKNNVFSHEDKSQNIRDNSNEQNAKIGLLGEIFILNYEKQKLNHLPLYANAIEHTSQIRGDSFGYDIKSFTEDGLRIFIEVKTTINDLYSNFFITRNEMELLKTNSNYYVYRVFSFDEKFEKGKLKIYKTVDQINEDFDIVPVSYSVKPNI